MLQTSFCIFAHAEIVPIGLNAINRPKTATPKQIKTVWRKMANVRIHSFVLHILFYSNT